VTLAIALTCGLVIAAGGAAEDMHFSIEGVPANGLVGVPVVSPVPHEASPGSFALQAVGDERVLPAQLVPALGGKGVELCLVVLPGDADLAGQPLRVRRPADPVAARFRFEEDTVRGVLHLFEEGKPVLDYCFGMQLKEGVPENRRRACYAHPIYGLDGEAITDDFPKDHYHHRGLFWGWPDMDRDGKSVSIWDLRGVEQRFDKWVGREVGPVCAQFETDGGWYVDGERVADERVCFRVWPADEVGRALDVYLRWTAVDKPIVIHGQKQENKGYGGPNLRFAPRPEGTTVITTPAGLQQGDGVYVSYPWTDLSAPFHGAAQVSGAAVFGSAANPRFPDAWLLRHYGILCVCWPGRDEVPFEPGKPVEMRYRVWIHRGDAEAGRVAEAYKLYAEPPTVNTGP